MPQTVSHVHDQGNSRFVVVVEKGTTVQLHATKYGSRESVLVSVVLTSAQAREMAQFILANTRKAK